MQIEITNKRVANTSDSTLGILYWDNEPVGFVIEDEFRQIKVSKETRIPAGRYLLKLRKENTSLTKRYRQKYPWFKYHIELTDVPNFSGIYIHVGNTERDTAGCQVIGLDASISGEDFINKRSTLLYERLYKKLLPMLEIGKEVYYNIIDE